MHFTETATPRPKPAWVGTAARTAAGVAVVTLLLHAFAALLPGLGLPPVLLLVSRWLALAALVTWAYGRGNLTAWILVGMLMGLLIGYDLPHVAAHMGVISAVFLRMIKTIIAPLLFATLVVGIAGHGDIKQVGRMGLKSMGYFISVTLVALVVGLLAINITGAGRGVVKPPDLDTAATTGAAAAKGWQDTVLHIFPENIAKSVVNGDVLPIVVFSVVFGIGLAMVPKDRARPMLHFCESLAETMFKFTNVVMYLAPLGVMGALAFTISKMGIGALENLFYLLATLYVALVVFLLGVLLPIALIARVPIRAFIKAIGEPVSLAFATASSEAALPKAMTAMERLGVPRKTVAFVIPTGYSFNLDGSTLYLSLACIFVAQAAGIQLSIGTQITMLLTLLLTSKGVAGVPRATLVILSATADSFNLPAWPIVMIIGIDQLMDMGRTSVNVIGNCLASVVIARWEGEFDPNRTPETAPEPALAVTNA